MKKEEFISLLNQNSVVLSEKQVLQFEQYLHLIQEYNKVMNLTGITEEEEVYEKHFYDSLLFSLNENMENKKLIELRDYLLPKLMSGEIDVSHLDLAD